MALQYSSKHGTVSRPPYELYLLFSDLRNFLSMLPEDKKRTYFSALRLRASISA